MERVFAKSATAVFNLGSSKASSARRLCIGEGCSQIIVYAQGTNLRLTKNATGDERVMDERTSTKSQVLALLRHRPMTVQEMAMRLGVTRNAIIVALQNSEAEGLIRRGGAERTGRAGKPAFHYEIVAESFERISPAYQAISPHLLRAGVQDGDGAAGRFLVCVGQSMHAELKSHFKVTGRVGLENTLNFLSSQGAEIEIVPDGKDRIVVSHSCPIGVLVRTDRRICSAIAALLSEATGLEVRDECIYADKLTCRFRLCAANGAAEAKER